MTLTTELNDPALLRADGYIDGQWVTAQERFDVTDPETGAITAPGVALP